ncbi:MAG: radical SAM protein [Paracoccaceae bacterium]|nr:radical SAM protein [Paracoccaceae bacterium]
MKITTFVLKIASRCNLDCTYCYVYNRGDTQWRAQPKFMSPEVARRTGEAIGAYCREAGIDKVNVQFHGGEPLMLGPNRLASLIDAVYAGIGEDGVEVSSALQTNGLLLTEEILGLLHSRGVGLYVSCDGPAASSDATRIDHQGRPVSDRLHQKLEELSVSRYRDIFEGFLCVINADSDPKEVFTYLAGFRPKAIDFLLPLENHDTPGFGKVERDRYAVWLMKCFNAWITSPIKLRSRGFERIIQAQLGNSAGQDAEGEGALVIECDGSFEADDTLKTAYNGAAVLDRAVFEHNVADVLEAPAFQTLLQAETPCQTCRECAYFQSCGGGHLSHRYANATGFDNPSVYCEQTQHLIDHIAATLNAFIQREKEAALA